MQNVTTADRVTGHHGDHGFRGATNLNLQVENVQPTYPLLRDIVITDVAIVATDDLVTTGTESKISLTR